MYHFKSKLYSNNADLGYNVNRSFCFDSFVLKFPDLKCSNIQSCVVFPVSCSITILRPHIKWHCNYIVPIQSKYSIHYALFHKFKFHSNLHFELDIFHLGCLEKLKLPLVGWENSVGIVLSRKCFDVVWFNILMLFQYFKQSCKKVEGTKEIRHFKFTQRCKLMNLNGFSLIFPGIILKVLLFLIK